MRFRNPIEAAGYVGGIIDGEGSVSLGTKHRAIRVSNTDLGVIEAYEEGLRTIGVQFTRRFKASENPRWQDMWVVTVWGRRNLENVYDLVPLHSVKGARLAQAIESFVLPNYYRKHEVTRERLVELIERGLTQREIAVELGLRSHSNAQYHLEKHGLRTQRGRLA